MAERSLRLKLRREPDSPEHIIKLALLLKDSRRLAEAEVYLKQALRIKPDSSEIYVHLGGLFMDRNRLREAAEAFNAAISLGDHSVETSMNLGSVLQGLGMLNEAAKILRFANDAYSTCAEAAIRLAVALTELHQLAEAESLLLQAEKTHPENLEIKYLQANIYFLQGRNDLAWDKYEARFQVHGIYEPKIRRWKGQALTGKKILLYHEQGFGDSIQYFRYAPAVSRLGGTAVLWLQKPLQRLQSGLPGHCVTHWGDELPAEKFDYACPLLSLPLVLQNIQHKVPIPSPYLTVDSAISQRWRQFFTTTFANEKPIIGVAWSGNSLHKRDTQRSIGFAMIRQLFLFSQFNWVSLQTSAPQAPEDSIAPPILDISRQLTDFAETAGIIDNLNLVISVDTAVAHLAGAMGKPTWLLLPFHPDPRWQLNRNDTPWYPSMQLFRQSVSGNWLSVLEEICLCLSLHQPWMVFNPSTSTLECPFTK